MSVYWEQSACELKAKNYNTKEENENCEIQKPHMQNIKDEKQMEDLVTNTILIFNLHMTNKFMNNNYKNEGFGMQKSEDDLSRVLTEINKNIHPVIKGICTIIRFVGTINKKISTVSKCIITVI